MLGSAHSCQPENDERAPCAFQRHEFREIRCTAQRDRDDTQDALVESFAGAEAADARQEIHVVRNKNEVGRGPVGSGRAFDLEVELGVITAEKVGEHLRRGAHLGVAVFLRLHDRCVEAEGHVVDEHPPVDGREVDPAFVAVDERIERTDHIVAVDAEVECKVISGAGGNAHERQIVFRGECGDECLGPVTTGHPDHICTASDGIASQRLEVVVGTEHDGLDSARSGLGKERFVRLPAS